MFFLVFFNHQSWAREKINSTREDYLPKHYVPTEVNCSFPLSKMEHSYAASFVLGFQNVNGDTFLKSRIHKRTKQNLQKTWKWKTSFCWKELFFVDKGRFKHILNIFKQRPSWCPLIHPSSSTFCPGSCYSGAPIQKGGPEDFLSIPHSWGTRDLAKLTAIFNLQCKYNNIFIKVLQGHPGKNQTTTKGNVSGPWAFQQLAFLGHFS